MKITIQNLSGLRRSGHLLRLLWTSTPVSASACAGPTAAASRRSSVCWRTPMPRIPGASSCRAAAGWGTCSRIWTRPCWTRRCSNGWWTSCRTGMTSGPHGKRRRPPGTRPRSRASVRGRPSSRPCTATIPSTRRRPCCPVWDSTRASGTADQAAVRRLARACKAGPGAGRRGRRPAA